MFTRKVEKRAYLIGAEMGVRHHIYHKWSHTNHTLTIVEARPMMVHYRTFILHALYIFIIRRSCVYTYMSIYLYALVWCIYLCVYICKISFYSSNFHDAAYLIPFKFTAACAQDVYEVNLVFFLFPHTALATLF